MGTFHGVLFDLLGNCDNAEHAMAHLFTYNEVWRLLDRNKFLVGEIS